MSKAIMLALPEVAYFVDRIPIGRVVVKADPIQLRFFQHARDSNMPLKDQCRVLEIPWHARKVPAHSVSEKALTLSRKMEATVFAAAIPTERVPTKHWIGILSEFIDGRDDIRHWLAFHALDVREAWADVKRYLSSAEEKHLASSLAPKTLISRARDWQAEQEHLKAEAQRRRREQMNMVDWRNMTATQIQRLYDQNPYQALQQQMEIQQRYQYEAMRNAAYQNRLWGDDRPRAVPQQYAVEDRSPIQYDANLLEPVVSGNLTVKLLSTHEEFAEEGKRMHHCVETYFPRAKNKGCYIVGVTKKGTLVTADKRVATAEFTPDWELIQAKGPANANVGGDVHIVTALRAFGAAKKQMRAAA